MTNEQPVKERPRYRSAVPVILLSAFFGLAAGLVGTMLASVYLVPAPESTAANFLAARERPSQVRQETGRVPTPVETASRSAVLFFAAKPAGRTALDQVYFPADAVAAGVVLTSDGWLISSGDALVKRPAAGLVAVVGAKSYPVRDLVVDPYSGVAFVKIDALNLPVVGFGDAGELAPGDPVFAFDGLRGPRRLDFIGYDDPLAASAADLVVSSERVQKVLRLSAAEGVPAGSMLLDRLGEVVGVFTGNEPVGSYGLPVESFSRQIGGVLHDKTSLRPYLGVNYLDLSRPLGGSFGTAGASRGALLMASPDGRQPAVAKRSPAAAAGLKEGDIIAAVNDEEITSRRALADIIAEYDPGTQVTLTVDRGQTGVERPAGQVTVTVKLGVAAK